MLSFLLFAGAFHIDWRDMRQGRWAILALASFGTLLSTALVGLGLKGLLLVVGHDMPLIWCLVFGALISPTDPVAVIAILKDAWLPPSIQATIATESLFNDGVGVVVFTIVFAAASGQQQMTLGEAARLFALEAGGGIVFGAVVGGIAFFLMRGIADLVAEVLITLAVVMGGYAAAQALGVSGPVAMAVAGLILGNQGVKYALSERSRDYVVSFWLLIDEILNAVLFLLVGLEAIAVWRENAVMLVALATVPIVLLARFISVGGPLLVLYRISSLGRGAVPILVWGGLRGGISIALALSIPEDSHKELILAATYAVVFFSVLVQGATIGRLAQRYRPDEDAAEAETT
ncbi:Na(+)/H(+) antiporter NhaP [Beijerinckiaceae bacterium RH AL1]|nr:Na(+)/H(+) antiporter NhaP [Beijerinckiaceae bacterium RH AL1]